MAMKCGVCGSLDTAAQGDTFCCVICGALTSFTGEVVRGPKDATQKGGPNGEPMDAAAGQSADFYAGRGADFSVPATKKGK